MPPPVTWAIARTSQRSSIALHRARVDPGRRQQAVGRVGGPDAGSARAAGGRAEPVGVDAGRGQADHRVARLDPRPADEPAPLGDPDREAGQVEVVLGVQVGQLGGLAAEQGAAGVAAALRRRPRRAARPARGRAGRPRRSRGTGSASRRRSGRRSRTSPRGRCRRRGAGRHRAAAAASTPTPSVPADEHRVGEARQPRAGPRSRRPAQHERRAGRLDRRRSRSTTALAASSETPDCGVGQRLALAHAHARRRGRRPAAGSNASLSADSSAGTGTGYSRVRQARQNWTRAARWLPAARRARGRRASRRR